MGCFNDSTRYRDLNYTSPKPSFTSLEMTVKDCVQFCRNASQLFAGLQYG